MKKATNQWFDIWKVPVDGGKETPVLENKLLEVLNWKLWRGNIVYRHRLHDNGPHIIESFDLETREATQLISFEAGAGFCYGTDVSRDGQWMLFSYRKPLESDITLVENFR